MTEDIYCAKSRVLSYQADKINDAFECSDGTYIPIDIIKLLITSPIGSSITFNGVTVDNTMQLRVIAQIVYEKITRESARQLLLHTPPLE